MCGIKLKKGSITNTKHAMPKFKISMLYGRDQQTDRPSNLVKIFVRILTFLDVKRGISKHKF